MRKALTRAVADRGFAVDQQIVEIKHARAQAIIDWRNRDIKKAYEEGVVQQAKGAAVPGQ